MALRSFHLLDLLAGSKKAWAEALSPHLLSFCLFLYLLSFFSNSCPLCHDMRQENLPLHEIGLSDRHSDAGPHLAEGFRIETSPDVPPPLTPPFPPRPPHPHT